MNFEHLKYLTAVAKLGSISAAARELYVSQPYLSGMVSRFEKELGFELFLRTPKRLMITDEGKAFFRSSAVILKELEKIGEISDPSQPPPLKIAALYSSFFTRIFLKYRAECSDCPLDHYMEIGNEAIIDSLADGTCNLGIICFDPGKSGKYHGFAENMHVYSEELLPKCPLYVLVSRAHPLAAKNGVSMADLQQYRYVTYDDPSYLRYLQILHVDKKTDTLRVSDRGVLMDAIHSGNYLTTVCQIDPRLTQELCLLPFTDKQLYIGTSVLRRENYLFTDREEEFLRFLRRQLEGQLQNNEANLR